MLTMLELKELLELNEQLMIKALRSKEHNSTQRLFELTLHRTVLKDTVIELLETRIRESL